MGQGDVFCTMECKNCGKEIPEDSKFCTFCGGKIIKQQSFLKMYYAQIRDVLFLSVFIAITIELLLLLWFISSKSMGHQTLLFTRRSGTTMMKNIVQNQQYQ